jgi:hypothetical protein
MTEQFKESPEFTSTTGGVNFWRVPVGAYVVRKATFDGPRDGTGYGANDYEALVDLLRDGAAIEMARRLQEESS